MTYFAPRSGAALQFFSSGRRGDTPQGLTLWAEPIIAVATIGVLHLDFGWPMALLGAESPDGAFDVMAYPDLITPDEYIACEIKKSRREIDILLDRMRQFAGMPMLEPSSDPVTINAYKKVAGLRARRPPFFWAVGPNGYNAALHVEYVFDGTILLHEVPTDALRYSGPIIA